MPETPVALSNSERLYAPGNPMGHPPRPHACLHHGGKSASWEGLRWSQCLLENKYVPGQNFVNSISGLVVEYIVAIDVTRARILADALFVPSNAVGLWVIIKCIV